MKEKTLFKKISAVITAAAMVASLGVTAFAQETVAVNPTLVSITDVSAGVYQVTVGIGTTGTIGNKGITMLTYLPAAALTDPVQGYATGMEIVGMNQFAETETSTSFKIATTTSSTATDYKMDEDQVGIIRFGGDGTTTTSPVVFYAPVAGTVAAADGTTTVKISDEYGDNTITAQYLQTALAGKLAVKGVSSNYTNNITDIAVTNVVPDQANEQVTCSVSFKRNAYAYSAQTLTVKYAAWDAKLGDTDAIEIDGTGRADMAAAVLNAVVAKGVQISPDGEAWTDVDQTKITVTEGTNKLDAANYAQQENLDFVVTIAAGAAVDAPQITLNIKATALADAWVADTAAYGTTETVDSVEKPGLTADQLLEEITMLVKSGSKVLALTDTEKGYTYNYTIAQNASDDVVVVDYKSATDTVAAGNGYVFTVTLKSGASTGDANVTVESDIAADFTGTYAADTREAINEVEAKSADGSEAITVTTVPDEATKTEIVTKAVAALTGAAKFVATYDGGTEEVTVAVPTDPEDWTITLEDDDDALEGDTDLEAGSYIAKFTVATIGGTACKGESVVITIPVTVSTPWLCGDVNHDGGVDMGDANCILYYYVGNTDYAYVGGRLSEADTNLDTSIDMADANNILYYYVGTIPTLPVE